MSDKDLLARLKAKSAQQSTPSPSAENAEGGSGLLDRLKAKSGIEDTEPAEQAPIVSQPQQELPEWTPNQTATIDVPQPPKGATAGVVPGAQLPKQQPEVRSTQKIEKTPFRDSAIKIKPKTPLEVQAQTQWATSALSNDFDGSIPSLAPQYQQQATTIAYTDPNNPIHKITNPHGDPAYTGTYLQSRINTLQSDINRANAEGDLQSRDKYQAALKDLREAGATMIDLQLFSKEYSGKQYLPEAANTATKAAYKQYEAEMARLNKRLSDIDKQEHPNSVQAEKERRRIQVVDMAEAEKRYQAEVRKIKSQTKYNPVLLGAEREMLLGNKDAKKDYEMLLAGKSIDPAKNYAYQDIGRRIIQFGIDNTQNENAKKEAAKHADVEGKALIAENLPVLVERARQVIGNKKYNDENPLLHSIVPSGLLANISKEDIKRYAEEEGFGEEITNELLKDPGAVPKSASLVQQIAKGGLNFLAPSIYSTGMRVLGKLYDVPEEKMDEFFRPGWQEERGLAAKIAGNMPSDQNSFRNIRGALGLMAETVGMMATFGPVAGEISKGISGATGIGEVGAERLANAGIMGFEGYNNAYNESKEIVGDKPEDEDMRQAYSLLSGIANGAIFSIHPPSRLVKAATGEMIKSGEQLVNEMRKVGLKGVMSSEIAPAYAKYIREIAKAQGVIVAQADANLMAQNALKNMFSKDGHKKSITEGLGEETLRTYISFFIPTLAGGAGAARSESPLNRAAAFEVATDAQKYRDFARAQLAEGKYTESEYRQAIESINILDASLKNTPVLNNHDEDLTPNQVKEYSFNLAQDAVLRNKVNKIKKEAEVFKREPDKAQLQPLEKRISELEKRRSEILDQKLVKVLPAEEPKKPEENLEVSEQKDISLQSDIDSQESSQQKTDQDGSSIESDQGRQSNANEAESTGQRQDSEVRQTADDQGRIEQKQDRLLAEEAGTPEEKPVEQGAPKRPAQRVKGQRRKFVEEEPELPLTEQIKVEPLSERGSIAHTKGAFKDASGKIYKSTEAKDGPTQEHNILTELQDLDNVVRVGKEKVQTDKGEAFEIEELTPLKEGEEITMEEAEGIMSTLKEMDDRGVYTGEFELGRDANGKLKIFDLSTAERRKDTKTNSSYSTFENNLFRVTNHLSKENKEAVSKQRLSEIDDVEVEILSEDYPELGMAYDRSGSEADQARRIEAAWVGVADPKDVSDRELYDAGYRFDSGKMLNPELLESRRKELKEYIVKQNKKKNASTRSKEQQQKGPEQGGKPEHEGVEQAGGKAKAAEAEDRDSNIGGKGQAEEVTAEKLEALKAQVDAAEKEMNAAQNKMAKKNTPENRQAFGEAFKKFSDLNSEFERLGGVREAVEDTGARDVTISKEEQDAAKNRRKEGKYTVDGIEYVRNEAQEGPVGSEGRVQFSDKEEEQFEYMLIEADQLQPSHVDGRRNPNFFIPEAQPKERSDEASILASDRIGENPDIEKVGASPNAYSGAPVVNERGEIVQGNNRGEGLKKHYRSGGTKYKKDLAERAAQFGLTSAQVESMDKPILVRRIKGSDEKAIRLGNYMAASIETGGKRRVDPVSTARRMSSEDKKQLLSAILSGDDTRTMDYNIGVAFRRIYQILRPYLNPAEIEGMIGRNGDHTPSAIKDVEAIVGQLLFEGGHPDLPSVFDEMPVVIQRGILKALPDVFGVSKENSLVPELQNAMIAFQKFDASGMKWSQWLRIPDMYKGSRIPEQIYTPLELTIAEMFSKARKQDEIVQKFKEYASKVNGIEKDPMDMFGREAVPGIPKAEAIKEVFNVEGYEQKEAIEKPAVPVEAKEEEGLVAEETPAEEPTPVEAVEEAEPEPDEFADSDKRLAEIAEEERDLRSELQKQLAAQKQYNDALLKAEREKDIEGWNKQNENLKKKEAKIAAINEKLIDLAKEERQIETDRKIAMYKRGADRIRQFGEDISKGASGMLGVFPVINTHLVKPFIDAVAEIYQHIGNLDVAISKAIDKFVFDGLQKSLTKADIRKIRPALEWMEKPVSSKPKLSKANEEIANEYVEDILDRDVDFTMDDAVQEIAEMEISDTAKAKLIDYIKWETGDRERYNAETLREPQHEGDFLDRYELKKSDKITKYLTGETQEDIFGQAVQYDLMGKETLELEDAVQDAANMIGVAKHHYGTNDVVLFGENLLGKIANMREGKDNRQTVKKILALSGLHNELHAERVRTEEKLTTADKADAQALRGRLRKINQIIAKTEVEHRNLVSSASEQLNAARAMRLVRNTFFKELFSERILNDAERREKAAVQDALEKTEVRDSVAEKGSFRTESEAREEVAAAEQAINDAKQSDMFEEAHKKKSKGVINRIKDKVSGGKKERKDGRKEIISKDVAEKKANKYLRGGTIEDLIQKAKEQTKKPC